jgi:phosphate starvation-inducible PhoH-like protein
MRNDKRDKSLRVTQRDKIKTDLEIREFPWTDKQKQLIEIISNKNCQLVFVSGPAGSSKTLSSIYSCLRLLNEGKVRDITYIRSAVESSDSHMGFLPGDLSLKMQFYEIPLMDKLNELLKKPQIEQLIKDERVTSFPPNFCRGLSFNSKAILLDEAQNSSFKEIVTIITRLGRFCKCIIMADPLQTDLKNGSRGGFEKLFTIFNNEESRNNGIFTFEFSEEDIVRSGLCQFIVKKLKDTPSVI